MHAHEIGTLKENRVGIDDLDLEVFASDILCTNNNFMNAKQNE